MYFECQKHKLKLFVYIQPNASKNEICGLFEDRIKIKIKSPPIDGKANKELISYLSKLLKIPKSNFNLLKGELGRKKTIEINGLESLPEALSKNIKFNC